MQGGRAGTGETGKPPGWDRMSAPSRVAVAGCGRWGRNYLRVLQSFPGWSLAGCCDADPGRLREAGRAAPGATCFRDAAAMLKAVRPDALVVATPASDHAATAGLALRAGVPAVLVEKPLADGIAAAERLVAAARRRRAVLMVGHILAYHRAVRRLSADVDRGRLGALRYLHSVRTNFGPVRPDVNVIWDLAPHDVSLLLLLARDDVVEVTASGLSAVRRGAADVAFATLTFKRRNLVGHLHVSWLDPHKTRRLTAVGTKGMAVFDDVSTLEPLRYYDRGLLRDKPYGDFGQFQLVLRDGDITIPRLILTEPLRDECAHFLACARSGRTPETDGAHGLKVVHILESLDASFRARGRPVRIA